MTSPCATDPRRVPSRPVRILQHEPLDVGNLQAAFHRTVAHLAAGDFRAADVKKLQPGPFYRAKLSDADRLIFRFGEWRGETCLILLEIVRHHAYAASRFLRGAAVDETRLAAVERPEPLQPADRLPLAYLNPARRQIHVLDKILSFDEDQEEALLQRPPVILIGSAGSGKTVLTLEKLRQLPGEILYVTHSPFLVDNARAIYFAHHYENDAQEVDFLSFQEFVQSIAAPPGRPLAFADFAAWFGRVRAGTPLRDSHALYEEFNGVLTGSSPGQPYLARDDYLALGVRRSVFPADLRPAVYDLFQRYLAFLPGSGCYDLNLVCHELHARCRPAYDFLVADEVQDMTAVQLSLVLRALRQRDQFVLCGDANQIVHPNFFSWAGVKTLFHERHGGESRADLIRVLNANYRNAPAVTEIANRLLRIKQARFGSIDRESHHLIRPVSDRPGGVTFLEDTEAARNDLDRKTSRSARFAVIVLREEDKEAARRSFHTPLVFSVREAKGLEYEHIILPGLVSSQPAPFREIAAGVTEEDLRGEFAYRRARDKSDRSLDAYKFYVNAFYVALTRAIAHVYILERDRGHPLLRLLDLRAAPAAGLAEQRSSDDEWREEALRLERQGKHDQVEAIRRTILHVEPVPWPVLTPAAAAALARETLAVPGSGHKHLRLLLDYAAVYNVPHLLQALDAAGFKSARQPEAARNTALQRYGVDYHQHGYRDLFRKVDRHGVDFRNPLNQTPLMLAAQMGLDALAARLIERGAGLAATDNWGRAPLHYSLRAAYQNPLYARRSLGVLYPLLCPAATNVRVGHRLVQVDRHRPAFFLLHSMLARVEMILRDKIRRDVPGFETADFIHALEPFPDSVIPLRHRNRQAITATLAGNEVTRDAPRNRQLFLRIRRGYYLPNPCLELERNGEWVNVLDLLNIAALEQERDQAGLTHFLAYFRKAQQEVAAFLARQAPGAPPAGAAPAPAEPGEASPERVPAPPERLAGTPRPNRGTGFAPEADGVETERGVSAEQQMTLDLDGAAAAAVPLLPDRAALAPLLSVLGPEGPRAPASADEQQRHARSLAVLRRRAFDRFGELEWMTREPRLGVACLLEFLEETVDAGRRTIARERDEGCCFAIVQLAEWREPRAYPLAVRLLQRVDSDRWDLPHETRFQLMASALAACCDGNLALLREWILDARANKAGRTLAIGTVAYLAVRRGLDADIAGHCFRTLMLLPPQRRDLDPGTLLLINMGAVEAWHLYPAALRGDLEAVIRRGWIPRRYLTLKAVAERAALPDWERNGSIENLFLPLPHDVWTVFSKRFASQQTAGDDEDWDDGDWDDGDEDDRPGLPPLAEPPALHAASLPQHPNVHPPADRPADGGAPGIPWPTGDKKVGRNDPCPCGSGRKYKKCCGACG